MKMDDVRNRIESLYSRSDKPDLALSKEEKLFLEKVIIYIDNGVLRAAEKFDGEWRVNEHVKKAILLYMKSSRSAKISLDFDNYLNTKLTSIYYSMQNAGARLASLENDYGLKYYDKVPLKFAHYTEQDFKDAGFRVVPGSIVRMGSFIGKRVVLMPSFVNIGAFIDEGTMIDTWATVGSCAQIGKNCHISGGAGIGGVLEPESAMPVIIEDDVFVGARSEIAEGVIVEKGSVIGMGVYISSSTKIINRQTGEVLYGRVPAGSVVVSGSVASSGGVNLYAAVIVKTVDEKTKSKTAITDLLRDV